jgi:hypothetical protein
VKRAQTPFAPGHQSDGKYIEGIKSLIVNMVWRRNKRNGVGVSYRNKVVDVYFFRKKITVRNQ